jgi:hypothetical protein
MAVVVFFDDAVVKCNVVRGGELCVSKAPVEGDCKGFCGSINATAQNSCEIVVKIQVPRVRPQRYTVGARWALHVCAPELI